MRKSKEHQEIYWFPSQVESTPVPFQHERDFTIMLDPRQDNPSLSIQDSNTPRTILLDLQMIKVQSRINISQEDLLYPQSGSQGQNLTNLSLTILKISCNQCRTMLNFV